MSLFETRGIKPMLLGEVKEPFDSIDYIYELKLDGIRCLAYITPDNVDLRNKRGLALIGSFPEMAALSSGVKAPCLLDGELIVMTNGAVDFEAMQSRAMSATPDKVALASRLRPASYVAFDILHYDGRDLIYEPLMIRKATLHDAIQENKRLAVSRYIEGQGISFYN